MEGNTTKLTQASISRVILTALIGIAATDASCAEDTSPPLTETALREDVRAADVSSLLNAFQHPANDASRALAAMGLDRVTWQLDHSSVTARTCAKALASTQAVTAFFCAKFEAGNLRLKGRYAEASRLDATAATTFAAAASADIPFQSFMRDNAVYAAMPSISTEHASDVTVPVRFDAAHAFSLDATVNGQVVALGLDTGSATTLTLATAKRLGVEVVVADHGKATGLLGKSSSQSLGVIDELKIGSAVVRHLPVEIIAEGRDVVGNDTLMQLGRFRLTKDTLTFPSSAGALSSCQEPMLVSTAAFGGGTLLVKPLQVNGATRLALIDTGDSFVLTGTASAAVDVRGGRHRRVMTRDLTRADQSVDTVDGHANITYGGRDQSVDFPIYPAANLPYPYILGGGALSDATLEVDFENAHVCLTRRS
jgi:predicted aspartyl protease